MPENGLQQVPTNARPGDHVPTAVRQRRRPSARRAAVSARPSLRQRQPSPRKKPEPRARSSAAGNTRRAPAATANALRDRSLSGSGCASFPTPGGLSRRPAFWAGPSTWTCAPKTTIISSQTGSSESAKYSTPKRGSPPASTSACLPSNPPPRQQARTKIKTVPARNHPAPRSQQTLSKCT